MEHCIHVIVVQVSKSLLLYDTKLQIHKSTYYFSISVDIRELTVSTHTPTSTHEFAVIRE
jgi:hypothetical protein